MASNILHHNRNTVGKDYFVGDIHGCYDELMTALKNVGFNFKTDILYSVGDLVDRGTQNLEVLRLLNEPWFRAVRGNHEDLMIFGIFDEYYTENWLRNGGDWFAKLSNEERDEVLTLLPTVNDLPHIIVVGDVAVLHAEYFGDFNDVENMSENSMAALQWGRTRIKQRDHTFVKNIKAVVVGHTPVEDATVLGNTVYIDNGAIFYNKLPIILSFEEVLNMVEDNLGH